MIAEYDLEDSPYSFGTTPIYNVLFKMLTSKDDETDTILINLATLVRNTASKQRLQDEFKEAKEKSFPFDTLAQDIVKETIKESKMLINDIVEMFKSKAFPLPRHIYVYMGDYTKAIPLTYLRTQPSSKQHVDLALHKLQAMYKNTHTVNEIDGVKVCEIYDMNTRTLPFRWLEREIRNVKNQHNVVMISHHPLDYHIARYVGHWCDIKSFHGTVLTPKDLGEKVLGYEYLPFTEKIHILLGDKTDLKPCLSQKAKKSLLEKAEKDSWYLKSKDYTDRELTDLNLITPYAI